MPTKTARKSFYSPHPSMSMVESSMRNLLERTGKSADQWVAIVGSRAPRSARVAEGGAATTNYAWWIAELSVGKGRSTPTPTLIWPRPSSTSRRCSRSARRSVPCDKLLSSGWQRARIPWPAVPDDGAALSASRVRADQAVDEHAHRHRLRASRPQTDRTADRHRRLRQKTVSRTDRSHLARRHRRRGGAVVETAYEMDEK